jgi:head-tail adaptor
MRAGFEAQDQRFTLEDPGQTVGGWGDATPAYTTRATPWGKLEQLSGVNRGGVVAEATHRITLWQCRTEFDVRWRVGVVGTTRKFDILSRDADTRQHERVVFAREVLQ